LHGWYTAKHINHSIAFMDKGVCTNQAESFFSRLRRMVGGQHHKVSPTSSRLCGARGMA
jgi:hypothetical protein